MELLDQVAEIVRRDGMASARALVEARVEQNDAEALALLGEWRLWGIGGEQDVVAGRSLIERAADLCDERATMMLVGLLNSGTAGPRDAGRARVLVEGLASRSPDAQRQVEIVGALPPLGTAVTVRDAPLVAYLDDVMSAAACDYLIEKATPKVQPSFVVDPQTGTRRPHPVRTSDGANFAPHEEDLVLNALNERIAAATGTDVMQGEPLHALHYRGGQQYRPHMDALPGVENQRTATAILYLNEGFDGGETLFTKRAVQVKARRGRLLIFANTDGNHRAEPLSEHAGLPVTQGEKWIVTRWIRSTRFHPWEPETAR